MLKPEIKRRTRLSHELERTCGGTGARVRIVIAIAIAIGASSRRNRRGAFSRWCGGVIRLVKKAFGLCQC